MKHLYTFVIALVSLVVSNTVWADASLIKVGGGIRGHMTSPEVKTTTTSGSQQTPDYDLESTSYVSFHGQLQTGFPFVPNLRLSSYSFKPEAKDAGITFPISHQRAELFYSFGFALVEAQLGATLNNFTLGDEDDLNREDTDYSGAGLAANLIIDVPALPLTPSVSMDLGIGDDSVNSYGINLAISLFVGLYLDVGIQNHIYSYKTKDDSGQGTGESIEGEVTSNTAYLGFSFNVGL